jgi:hypothetical protein
VPDGLVGTPYTKEETVADQIAAERNRMRRRDKKQDRRRHGMRVDDSARRLARVKLGKLGKSAELPESKVTELIEFFAANDPDYLIQKMREVFDPDLL